MLDYFEHIDAYIGNELNAADKAAFEAAMLTDEKLKLAVDNVDVVKKTLLDFLELDVRNTIENANDIQAIDRPSKKWWLLAAVIIILSISAVSIYLIQNSGNQPSNYASLEIVDPIYNTERSETLEVPITKAINLHLAGKSERAIEYLKSLRPLNQESKYWIMEIMISQKQVINKAWIAELESTQYQSKRISYLKIINMVLQGNKSAARSTLKDMPTDNLGVREYEQLQKYLTESNN